MNKLLFILFFLISLTGCGNKMTDNSQLIQEMQSIAERHIQENYNTQFVVDKYKFLPKHVGPDISFYGHSKDDPEKIYTVRIDYEDKVVKFVFDNDHSEGE